MTRRDDAHEWTNGKMHERYESRVVEHTAALREQKALAKFLALFSHVAVNFNERRRLNLTARRRSRHATARARDPSP